MNVQQPSQQPKCRQKRFSRKQIIALSIILFVALLLIALIVGILLAQNVTQGAPLIGLLASIVTIVLGPTSIYIWILESTKRSSEEQHDAHAQNQQFSESYALSSNTSDLPLTSETPISSQTLADVTMTSNEGHQIVRTIEERGGDALPDHIPFQAGHPLPRNAVTYIERQADQDALVHLRNMEYMALIDARQQGKTSLILHLMQKLSKQNYNFVIFDLSQPKFQNKTEEEWYKGLGDTLLRELRFLPPTAELSLPTDSTSWEFFLSDLAEASRQAKQKTVIILDEVREIPSSYATPFFTVIRMVFNQRPLQRQYESLTFIISGVFNPNELIRDEQVSKFIAQRIHLDDFDLAQVKQLVTYLRLSDELTEVAAQRIYYWTDGQPYLTQKVCQLLSIQVLPRSQQDLSNLIERLSRHLYDDSHYLYRIKRLYEKEPELFQYAQRIALGNRPYFSSGLLDPHFRLAYIYGVIKADVDGYCTIRNRICEHALTRIITQPLQ